jgi:hypothetical protein
MHGRLFFRKMQMKYPYLYYTLYEKMDDGRHLPNVLKSVVEILRLETYQMKDFNA